MPEIWTIIGVADVKASLAWYETLLGQSRSVPVHDYFAQVADNEGRILLCLHRWGDHDHPSLRRPSQETGNGLLLFFRVDDFDAALDRTRGMVPQLEEEPHLNPNTLSLEFSLRDPDGYFVTISARPK